jgi:hypothetical protein
MLLLIVFACTHPPSAGAHDSSPTDVGGTETGAPDDTRETGAPDDTGETGAVRWVDMVDYFPAVDGARLYRVPSGRVYLKQVLETWDERLSLVPDTPGATHYVLHDYLAAVRDLDGVVTAGSDDAEDALYYADTWHLRNDPDGAISEVADSFALTGDDGSPAVCTTPCLGRVAVYDDQVIGHGRPGGHTVGEDPYTQDNIQMWIAPDGVTEPTPDPAFRAWSSVQVVETLDSYTPAWGNRGDGFGADAAPTWNDVVVVVFGHGATYPGLVEPLCDNQPAATPHIPGYSSFWQLLYLAPDVGWIQIDNLYYEPLCDGTLTGDPAAWTAYLDTFTTCENPAPEVVVNTCEEIGYPPGWVGSYTSTRQYLCATGRYTEWEREDTCHAP